jgi:hypothetical protein
MMQMIADFAYVKETWVLAVEMDEIASIWSVRTNPPCCLRRRFASGPWAMPAWPMICQIHYEA